MSWISHPLNTRAGMPLGPRTSGYHDAARQTQRVIGRHVYIMQPSPAGLSAWRLEMADGVGGYRWTLVHRWPATGLGGQR